MRYLTYCLGIFGASYALHKNNIFLIAKSNLQNLTERDLLVIKLTAVSICTFTRLHKL